MLIVLPHTFYQNRFSSVSKRLKCLILVLSTVLVPEGKICQMLYFKIKIVYLHERFSFSKSSPLHDSHQQDLHSK